MTLLACVLGCIIIGYIDYRFCGKRCNRCNKRMYLINDEERNELKYRCPYCGNIQSTYE